MRKGRKALKRGTEAEMDVRKNVRHAAEIFDRYGEEVEALIRFQVQDESSIDDIFQNLFLSLVNNPIPPGISNVKGYLYRAVTHDIIDSMRRARNYQSQASKIAERRQYVTLEDSPESTVIEVEQLDQLSELIKERLPRCEAEAVVLTCIDELDAGEAARRMGVNRRTVSRYKCIGLRKIRRYLQEEGCLGQYPGGTSR
ncbi:MAG: RNA polymerase sigma factor [Planctomycetota bacterium]|jgi:RNA polymerase sigma factor (sigma-70 family)